MCYVISCFIICYQFRLVRCSRIHIEASIESNKTHQRSYQDRCRTRSWNSFLLTHTARRVQWIWVSLIIYRNSNEIEYPCPWRYINNECITIWMRYQIFCYTGAIDNVMQRFSTEFVCYERHCKMTKKIHLCAIIYIYILVIIFMINNSRQR